jgi:hypothetical protein
MLRRLSWNAFVKPVEYTEAHQALAPSSHPMVDQRLWWNVVRKFHPFYIKPELLAGMNSVETETLETTSELVSPNNTSQNDDSSTTRSVGNSSKLTVQDFF